MKKYLIFSLLLCITLTSTAQVAVNNTNAAPDPSAMLDVSSTSKGVLFPRVALDSLKDLTTIANPANGLMVYNTTSPGARYDLTKGYYYFDATAQAWVKFTDNSTDNPWEYGGWYGVKERTTQYGVEMHDGTEGIYYLFNAKNSISEVADSQYLYSPGDVTTLVLRGSVLKNVPGWMNRQKTSIVFENSYKTHNGGSGVAAGTELSAYVENTPGLDLNRGMAFYTFSFPQFSNPDTPTVSMLRRNVSIGKYAIDNGSFADGRLQVENINSGDHFKMISHVNPAKNWSMYVDGFDGNLHYYSNGGYLGTFDHLSGAYTSISDARFKKDIQPLGRVLPDLMKVRTCSYHFLGSKPGDRLSTGVIAQEFKEVFPSLVQEHHDRQTNEVNYSVNYSEMGVLAIKAIQEQQDMINAQQKEIDALKAELESIRQMLKQNK
jgi:hypothetical protein